MKKRICWCKVKTAIHIMLLSLILLPFSSTQASAEEASENSETATVKEIIIETRVESMKVTLEENETASEISRATISGIVATPGTHSNISEETVAPTPSH